MEWLGVRRVCDTLGIGPSGLCKDPHGQDGNGISSISIVAAQRSLTLVETRWRRRVAELCHVIWC